MSYLVLARKWRPQSFEQIVGQSHVVKALINSLTNQRLHHAYLFTGTRGVGKTTIARLLAKALNCEQGISATPCLQCSACVAIEQGRFVDMIEIDGASRTRVEDTREILENVQYSPSQGRFKIYIIDEVHMLSNHSFNALLKTLEEPPEHIKFILATTDPQKLPVTVLSRCLQFSLRNMPKEQIEAHLNHILTDESIESETSALSLVALAANGSMRDALSLLDQAIAYCDEKISVAGVREMLGFTQHDYALDLLHALCEKQGETIIKINQELLSAGANPHHVLDDLIAYLHQLSLLQTIQSNTVTSNDDLNKLAKKITPQDTQLFYQIAIMGKNDMPLAPTPAIGLDMVMLRMLAFEPASVATLPQKECETKQAEHGSEQQEHTILAPKKDAQQQKNLQKNHTPLQNAPTQDVLQSSENNFDLSNWSKIVNQLNLNGIALSVAQHAILKEKNSNLLNFTIESGHLSMLSPTVIRRLENALSEYFNQNVKVNFESATQQIASPARQKQTLEKKQANQAKQSIEQDPIVQDITARFDGKLINDSIKHAEDEL